MKELTDKQIGFILGILQTILEKLEEEIKTNSTVVRRTSTGSTYQVPNELGEAYLDFLKNSNDMVNPLINFWDVTEGIDSEMERLDWDERRGRQYLLWKYGKKSRYRLSDIELLEFWSDLINFWSIEKNDLTDSSRF
jgi:hypothetical protein